jgi:ATP-dependent RNA helicase SUPV3L1/SUV3
VKRESEPDLTQLRVDPDHPFAKLAAFRAGPGVHAPSRPGSPAWVEEIVEAAHAHFVMRASGEIAHAPSDRVVGRIARGGSIAQPAVHLADLDVLGAGAKSRLQRRLLAFARDAVDELLGGIGRLATPSASAPVRAFVHRLEGGLGTALASDLDDVLAVLSDSDRAELERCGVRFGAGVVYLPGGLAAPATTARVALTTIWFRTGRALSAPAGGAVSLLPSRGIDRVAYTALGFPVVGPRAIRADVLDRLHAHVQAHASEEPLDEAMLATWIGAPKQELRRVLSAHTRE